MTHSSMTADSLVKNLTRQARCGFLGLLLLALGACASLPDDLQQVDCSANREIANWVPTESR